MEAKTVREEYQSVIQACVKLCSLLREHRDCIERLENIPHEIEELEKLLFEGLSRVRRRTSSSRRTHLRTASMPSGSSERATTTLRDPDMTPEMLFQRVSQLIDDNTIMMPNNNSLFPSSALSYSTDQPSTNVMRTGPPFPPMTTALRTREGLLNTEPSLAPIARQRATSLSHGSIRQSFNLPPFATAQATTSTRNPDVDALVNVRKTHTRHSLTPGPHHQGDPRPAPTTSSGHSRSRSNTEDTDRVVLPTHPPLPPPKGPPPPIPRLASRPTANSNRNNAETSQTNRSKQPQYQKGFI